ncbi:MAG: DUF3857 and transglutaminase domain-containing protein [Halanaerobiaceae bacterium]|nr:DUF3857 and transglutaminase domain-containing protein [Halanaerobiaceae bacterium]
MIKKCFLYLCFFLLVLLSIPVIAVEEAEIQAILQNAPLKEDYPEAGAVILKHNMTCDFTKLPYTYRVDRVCKIFNKRGIEEFAEARIQFDKERERVEILKAYTIKSDGTVIEAGENSIHEITPPELAEANIYSNVKELVINFPGVEEDTIIVYSYLIEEAEPLIRNQFWQSKEFAYIEPIKETCLEIIVPEDKALYYKTIRGDFGPVIEKADGCKKYVWERKDIAAVPVEFGMLPLLDIVPLVRVSTFADWKEFNDWYRGLITDQYKINDTILRKIEELTAGLDTEEEKIRALYNYVAGDFRYVGLEFGIDGYKPHNAVETFENKYGDCKDKATLLIALLSAIGVRAEPVLINTAGHSELEIASPDHFNHMIVYLPNLDLYLDPTNGITMYGDLPAVDQGKKVVMPLSNWISETPVFPAENNREHFYQKIELSENGSARINVTWLANGAFDSVNKLLFTFLNEQQRTAQMGFIMNHYYPGSEIQSCDFVRVEGLEDNFRIDFSLSMKNYTQKMGNLLTIKAFRFLPAFAQLVGSSERENAVYLGHNMNISREIEIELPEGVEVNYLPEDVWMENETGSLKASFLHDEKGIQINLDFKTVKHIIEKEQYQDLKELFDKAAETMNQQILLMKK